jgi:hypothetical protein
MGLVASVVTYTEQNPNKNRESEVRTRPELEEQRARSVEQ